MESDLGVMVGVKGGIQAPGGLHRGVGVLLLKLYWGTLTNHVTTSFRPLW